MVEVAGFGSGIVIAPPLVSRSTLRSIGCGGSFAGAKIALDPTTGCRTFVMAEEGADERWESESLNTALASPRRQVLGNIFAARNERLATREQRRLEVERELLLKLGLNNVDTDGLSPNSAPSDSAVSIDNVEESRVQTPTGNDVRPPSRSERPGSGRRPCLSCSSGPPRPPKPKPHRPLNLHEDTLLGGERSADNLPQERRWKSALLPVWPDRHGSESCTTGVSMPISSETADTGSQNVPGANLSAACMLDIPPILESQAVVSVAESPTFHGDVDFENLAPNERSQTRVSVEEETGCSLETAPPLAPLTVTVAKSVETAEAVAFASERTAQQLQEEAEQERCLQEVAQRERHAEESAQLEERTRELEASAKRLREQVERLRLENRRSRILGTDSSRCSTVGKPGAIDENYGREQVPFTNASPTQETMNEVISTEMPKNKDSQKLEEMRRKIAELDKISELERQRLVEQELQAQERRRQQEEFERGLHERTEREMQEHRDREAEAEMKRIEREEGQQREREERERRRRDQLHEQETQSRRLEERRREGRSEATQQKWQLFEEDLEKQWAEQDKEERRRVDSYAKERRKRYEDWDRRLVSERQKFASEAEFTEAARHRHARNSAQADEQFYGFRRGRGVSSGCSSGPVDPPRPTMPPLRPHPPGNAEGASTILLPEECGVLKELHSMRNQPRESQKAKVKELLFRWHPDKNPTCAEKATRVFQFIQRQREIILGL